MADSQSKTGGLDAYWRTRNYKTSARLHLQHSLFQNTIGYLIHPQITESWKTIAPTQEVIRIADLGCGNAKWLSDVSKMATSKVPLQLHGFDINPGNFPAQRYLANNIKLEEWDILSGEIPTELANSFDVVHIRAFTSCVRGNNPGSVLKNATALLKPGGWLQWEESPPDQLTAVAPVESVSKAYCDVIVNMLSSQAKKLDLVYSWLYELETHMQNWKLEQTRMTKYDYKPEDFKAWTENYLVVWEEIDQILPSKIDAPDASATKEMWQDLFLKAVDETNNGVIIGQQQIVVVIGHSPM